MEDVEPHLMIYKYRYGEDELDLQELIGFCRLSLIHPEYMTGYNENYILSDEEMKFLYEKLLEREDYIIETVHYNYNICDSTDPYTELNSIPNYLELVN